MSEQERQGEERLRQHAESKREQAEGQRQAAEEERSNLHRLYLRMASRLALPLAFIALIPSLIGLYLLDNEVNSRIDENRLRIADITALTVSTNKALCTFERDLQNRYREGVNFLREHPGPNPFPGLTRASITLSLSLQKQTIDSLGDLHCR